MMGPKVVEPTTAQAIRNVDAQIKMAEDTELIDRLLDQRLVLMQRELLER